MLTSLVMLWLVSDRATDVGTVGDRPKRIIARQSYCPWTCCCRHNSMYSSALAIAISSGAAVNTR